jgi:uncharacterized protein with FMN-binding domain
MKLSKAVPGTVMAAGLVLPIVFTAVLLPRIISTPSIGTPSGKPPKTGSASGGTTYAGKWSDGAYGPVQAVLTISGSKIVSVQINIRDNTPTGSVIDARAVPVLQRETLEAQSARIDTVSGATQTSVAYASSLASAIRAADKSGVKLD